MKTSPKDSNVYNHPAPQAGRKHSYGFVWLALGLALWMAAGYLAVIQIDRLRVSKNLYQHLLERGIAAEAKIMARSPSGGKQYIISYLFHTLDAELQPAWFAKNTQVSASTFQQLDGAKHVDILYDPLDPNASKIERENKPPGTEQYLYAGTAVLFCMVGMVIFVRGFFLCRHAYRNVSDNRPSGI